MLVALLSLARPADAQEAPTVTPYRPTVSTPAELSVPGYLEFELGALTAPGPARRDSLPYTAKLAFDEDWGLRVGGDAWVRNRATAGPGPTGPGDTSIVLKHRIELSEESAWGWELGCNLPTGRAGIGAGTTAYSLTGIYSRDFGASHLDLNLGATRSDSTDAATGRVATAWALALSHAVDERWELAVEYSGARQRGVPTSGQALFAVSYSVSRSLVIDAGVARNVISGTVAPAVFTGFTILGPQLF